MTGKVVEEVAALAADVVARGYAPREVALGLREYGTLYRANGAGREPDRERITQVLGLPVRLTERVSQMSVRAITFAPAEQTIQSYMANAGYVLCPCPACHDVYWQQVDGRGWCRRCRHVWDGV